MTIPRILCIYAIQYVHAYNILAVYSRFIINISMCISVYGSIVVFIYI